MNWKTVAVDRRSWCALVEVVQNPHMVVMPKEVEEEEEKGGGEEEEKCITPHYNNNIILSHSTNRIRILSYYVTYWGLC